MFVKNRSEFLVSGYLSFAWRHPGDVIESVVDGVFCTQQVVVDGELSRPLGDTCECLAVTLGAAEQTHVTTLHLKPSCQRHHEHTTTDRSTYDD